MRRFLSFLILFFPLVANCQERFASAVKIKPAALPASLKIRGKVDEAWKWKDKLGTNYLVLSKLDAYKAKSSDAEVEGYNLELFAVHFVQGDTGFRTLWRLNDIVKECGLDHTCDFLKASTTITDLDKDSIAETKVQYKLACRGDVSPSYMKLIMHEDSIKYALRGSMWIKGGGSDTICRVTEKNVNLEKLPVRKDESEQYEQSMGRYESEKDFTKAPSEFLVFARREWLKHVIEKFEE